MKGCDVIFSRGETHAALANIPNQYTIIES